MMKKYLLVLLLASIAPFMKAQNSRDYIKQCISSWGTCRNVAITDNGGDLALNYSNQYAISGIPTDLANAMKNLHDTGELIDDVQLTENGRWLILYGNNGFRWSNIPYGLESALREFNNSREVVTTATFNDNGDWIVISTEHIQASTSEIYNGIQNAMSRYGQLWTAHLTNDGLVLCYANGYQFSGRVPDRLRNALTSSHFNVYRIKFTSRGSYFFADSDGRYSYWM